LANSNDKPDFDKPEHLGHVVWEMRDSMGIGRAEVAELIGVTERTLYNIETGKTDISLQKFDRIVASMRRSLRNHNGLIFEERFSASNISRRVFSVVRLFLGGAK
jgi:DNA-binding XRE family transcriptional regulator